jgi:hypothetical protein
VDDVYDTSITYWSAVTPNLDIRAVRTMALRVLLVLFPCATYIPRENKDIMWKLQNSINSWSRIIKVNNFGYIEIYLHIFNLKSLLIPHYKVVVMRSKKYVRKCVILFVSFHRFYIKQICEIHFVCLIMIVKTKIDKILTTKQDIIIDNENFFY